MPIAMSEDESIDIGAVFAEGTPIDEAMNEAVRDAVRLHRQAGLPLAVWEDGRVQYIWADEVRLDDDPQPTVAR